MNEIQLRNADKIEIVISPEALALRDNLLTETAAIVAVTDDTEPGIVRSLGRVNGFLKDLEESRQQAKRPALDFGKRIDAIAAETIAKIFGEKKRVSLLLSEHELARRLAKEAAERKRLEEERKAQEERNRIERERIKAEQDARDNQARIEREFNEARQKEEGAVKTPDQILGHVERFARKENGNWVVVFHGLTQKATDKRSLALAISDAAELEIKNARAHQERLVKEAKENEAIRLAEQERLSAEARKNEAERLARQSAPVPVAPQKAKGSISRDVPKFEVLDIKALYAHSPHLVNLEPRTSDINRTLAAGAREIPGLRIWVEVQVGARSS